jgi:hypothetical protein
VRCLGLRPISHALKPPRWTLSQRLRLCPADGPAYKAERQLLWLLVPYSTLSTSIFPILAILPSLSCNNCKWRAYCCCKDYIVVWMCALGVKLATAEAILDGRHDKPYNDWRS